MRSLLSLLFISLVCQAQVMQQGIVATTTSGAAPPAITQVNKAVDSSSGTSTTISAPATSHTSGNTIAVFFRSSGGVTITGVSDTAMNSYSACSTLYTGQAGISQWWCACNITGNASNVVTGTFDNNTSNRAIHVIQYSGIALTSCNDVDAGGHVDNTVTTATSSSFTTSQASEVLLMGVNVGGFGTTFTQGTGWTIQDTSPDGFSATEGKIVSSIQTGVTADMSFSSVGFGQSNAVASLKGQ